MGLKRAIPPASKTSTVEAGRRELDGTMRQLRSSRDWGRMPFLKYEQD
jgi:hypothetical protein